MMRRRGFLGACAATALSGATPPQPRWVSKYFYDEDGSSLFLTDFRFASQKRGVATGVITSQKEKDKPVVLVTTDGGTHWSLVPVKDAPRSLFLLPDGTGWMIGEKNVWKTEESGRSWQKLNNAPKDLLRLWFNSRDRGWAIGVQKRVFETIDGGATWVPVAAAGKPGINPATSVYNVIEFANERDGIIAGWNDPPRRGDLPNWLDPAKAKARPQWPTTLALLQTRDGGATWNHSTASIFGHLTRISLTPDGRSLGLVEFNDSFPYPSEVHLANRQTGGKSERVFRQANRFITDVLLTPSGTAYLAGPEAIGTVRNSPVPGKLRILTSTDCKSWVEMPVDYRADAHRAFIASAGDDNVWVATDTGMILQLVKD